MKYLLTILIFIILTTFMYLFVASTYEFAVAIRQNRIAKQQLIYNLNQ
jgi:hypothetical protein